MRIPPSRFSSARIFWTAIALSAAGVTIATVFTGDDGLNAAETEQAGTGAGTGSGAAAKSDEAARKPVAPVLVRDPLTGACLADPAAVEDLQKRRDDLDARQKELAAKDAELKAREKALDEELRKLEQAREDIEKISASRKKENEERVNKLVETIEGMSPKAASQLVSTLDEALAVQCIEKMSTAKLSKIMNVMEPARSSRLTEILAGVVRARGAAAQASRRNASIDAPATAAASPATSTSIRKGGEKNDGQIEHEHDQQKQPAHGSEPSDGKRPGGEDSVGKGAEKGQNG